jgi:alkylation response protein AidB-like acyl-CoA dehydrogenase
MLDAARALAPELAARATEAEVARTMPDDLVDRARAAGLFRLALPISLGGLELEPATIVEVVEELSRADGSAGWTVLIGNSTAFFAWLDPRVARDLIGATPDFVSTSMFSPNGRAVADAQGGLILDGRWPFNSGCPHADWFQTGIHVFDGQERRRRPDGQPDWRFAFFAREGGTIFDTWDAMGLRGTGSHDVEVRGLRVPEEHTAAPFFTSAPHDGPLWRFRFIDLLAVFMSGFPLGVGRRALDEFAAVAAVRRRGPAAETLAGDGHVQFEIGRYEAELLAARSLVFDAIGEAWERACQGDPPAADQEARIQVAAQNAMRAGVAAVDAAYTLTGASAVYSDHPLQRCFRDIHTATQHAAFRGEGYRSYARSRFGLEASGV